MDGRPRSGSISLRAINSSGGILGRTLELIYRDDKSSPETAAEAAQKSIKHDDVVAMIGPIFPAARDKVVPIIEKARMPLIYGGSYEGGRCGRYTFHCRRCRAGSWKSSCAT
jgi:ABC-type branched-subunit amino acid transport system substrate-binding protein